MSGYAMPTIEELRLSIREVLTEEEIDELKDTTLITAAAKAFWKVAKSEDNVFSSETWNVIMFGVTLCKGGFLEGHAL